MPIAEVHFRISVRLRCGLSKVRFVGCARRLLRASERWPWSSTRIRARCRLHLDTTPNGAPGARGLLGTCRCVRLSSVPPPVTSAETEVRAVRTQVHALSEKRASPDHQKRARPRGREVELLRYRAIQKRERGRATRQPQRSVSQEAESQRPRRLSLSPSDLRQRGSERCLGLWEMPGCCGPGPVFAAPLARGIGECLGSSGRSHGIGCQKPIPE